MSQIKDVVELIIVVFIQVSADPNRTEVHRISHENAAGSKKKMVAGKSYYRC